MTYDALVNAYRITTGEMPYGDAGDVLTSLASDCDGSLRVLNTWADILRRAARDAVVD